MTNKTMHNTSYKLIDIEGIGPEFTAKLKDAGIQTTEEFLVKASTPELRSQLSSRTGIGEGLLVRWFQMADLMRLKGIGPQYAELLVAAGVPSLEKLGTYQPADLIQTLARVNTEKHLAKSLPTVSDVENWFVALKEAPVPAPKH